MNNTARKLVTYGILGIIIGTLAAAYGADLFVWISNIAGNNAEPGLAAVSLIITLIRGLLVPVGAALIGAGIVINFLLPVEDKDPHQN